MHNLDQSIAEWRRDISRTARLGPDTLDELESHLRETISQLVRSGIPEMEAFQRAMVQLGPAGAVTAEFQKLSPSTWLPFRIMTVIAGVAALVMCGSFRSSHWDILLATHSCVLTLGYVAGLLLGGLGICFVVQRSFAEFSTRRSEALARGLHLFGSLACALTVAGMILGMWWSHREWGRFWGWDPREIGALSVVLWQLCFLAARRFRRTTVRGLFVASLVGSSIVLMAMFRPQLFSWGVHVNGMPVPPAWPILLLLANFLFFLVGLAPAGWLRPQKA